MSVVYLILPLAMLLGVGAVWLFINAVRKGQFDDLETPAMRVLFEDEEASPADVGDAGCGDSAGDVPASRD